MKRIVLAAGLLIPSTCFASGDPAVLFWIGGVALSYLVSGVLLVIRVFTRKLHWIRLPVLVAVSIPAWVFYLDSGAGWLATQSVLLAALPWLFVIRRRTRSQGSQAR